MNKIIFILKVGLGIAIVLAAGYSLSPFGGLGQTILGAGLMLAGVALAVILEKRRRIFLSAALLAVFLMLFIPWFQYFGGGFAIYFACYIAIGRNKVVYS